MTKHTGVKRRFGNCFVAIAVVAISLAAAQSARAQGAVCTIDLLGNKYDVFVIPRVSGLVVDMRAINNTKIFTSGTGDFPFATAVGDVGIAVGYGPEQGISFFDAPDLPSGGDSAATAINHDDDIVGHYKASTFAKRRAFLFTVDDRFKFLDDLYPSVADLTNDLGAKAWAINDGGQIVLTDGEGSTENAYVLETNGALTPIPSSELDCVEFGAGMLSNRGDVIPAGRRGGDDACAEVHTALNDLGTVVGYNVSGATTTAIRDGNDLPGGADARATDINADGYVGGYPGVVWTPGGDKHDIGQAIKAQADCSASAGSYLGADGTLPQETYINDELWISTNSLFMRPASPDIVYGTTGTGFEFFDDGTPEGTGVGVRVGNQFTLDVALQNIGRNALRNITIEANQDPSLFRQLSGPDPPLPVSLEPDATFQAHYEFEAVGAGILQSVAVVKGTDPSGVPFEFPQAARRILFVGNGGLNAKITAEPAEVQIGDEFTVRLIAENVTAFDLTDVGPTGPLTFLGEATATVKDGPNPSAVATLGPGASAEFVYTLQATKGGSMTIHAILGGTTEQGDDVSAEAQCGLGSEPSLVTADAEAETSATCPLDGGAAVEVKLCKVSVTDYASPIRAVERAPDADPPASDGYPAGAT